MNVFLKNYIETAFVEFLEKAIWCDSILECALNITPPFEIYTQTFDSAVG